MKRLVYTSLLLLLKLCITGCSSETVKLHVVTFNIRLDLQADGINRWENRVPLVKAYFTEENPDIIGMQEVLHNQLLDLGEILPEYDFVGTGRDDGITGGEYSPIFFRTDRFKLLNDSQFWLSQTPEVPGSMGWDASYTRIVTWAELEDMESGKVLFVFNTHFDHRGVEARTRSIELMSANMEKIANDAPLIAMGDFNIRKNHPSLGSDLYHSLIEVFKDNNSLLNSEYIAKKPVTSGGATSNGFSEDWIERPPYAIDYIFVNPHFYVEEYRVDHVKDGEIFISDHWPVVSKINYSE
jgi:endonuclease/exonuclease/phosphatase family metal-dependent hydrolase